MRFLLSTFAMDWSVCRSSFSAEIDRVGRLWVGERGALLIKMTPGPDRQYETVLYSFRSAENECSRTAGEICATVALPMRAATAASVKGTDSAEVGFSPSLQWRISPRFPRPTSVGFSVPPPHTTTLPTQYRRAFQRLQLPRQPCHAGTKPRLR